LKKSATKDNPPKLATMKKLTIAIDGPVCSGKGTLSIALAKKLNILYLYTGGMYRALTLASIRAGVDLNNEEEVLKVFRTSDIKFIASAGETKIFLNGEEVSDKLFEPTIANNVPIVASHPKIREEMVERQKAIAKGRSSVIEGRDISSMVAPDADVKIYLTADIKIRAGRRLKQYKEKGIQKTLEEVLEETSERDRIDAVTQSQFKTSNDIITIDTTNDTIDDTVEKVINILREKGLYDLH
jgi:cytidylate kinase